ncbi:hypothetical protein SCHPADRAFT_852640 [Schizopora paradoxa]|uniref:RING-type domain-containing protein n=1 Tax=Schizopora paradoxa TaxID=27342 RepID=A0A0H2RMY6_9AGAM|nr:hypothetical protein SCHPADRAFT_852640 [Schizopora paradoxa]
MADSTSRGMPLLSGPPPVFETASRSDLSCRRCNKEFNVVFVRDRRCNHCGYLYCHSCSDFQALMPRQGVETGYDPMSVCAFCIQYLTITAGGKGYLRTQALARLRNYIQAYNIKIGRDILEKDDIIDAIVAARNNNGCLPRANEDFYRKHAVPNGQSSRPRGLFSRSEPRPPPRQNVNPNAPLNHNSNFARPDLDSSPSQQQQYPPPPNPPPRDRQRPSRPPPSDPAYHEQQRTPRPPPPPPTSTSDRRQQERFSQSYTPPPPPPPRRDQYAPPPYPPPPSAPRMNARYTSNTSTSTTTSFSDPRREPHVESPRVSAHSNTNTQHAPPRPPPPRMPSPPRPSATSTTPTLDELVAMTEDAISRLSVGKLKAILMDNHVNAGMILEKSELIAKVKLLIETERQERERAEAFRLQEELEEQWRREERDLERQRQREEEERRARERLEREQAQWREEHRTTVEEANDEDHNRSTSLRDSGDYLLRPSTPPAKSDDAKVDSGTSSSESQPKPSRSAAPPPSGERSGICVICTDEEANIVIVDCGHLAMCRNCSDLVMKSTRECPLCRTRIVTEKRLLRVFKS